MNLLTIEKVTAFIIRPTGDLLLFQHPYAGIQLPAGTVEEGETIEHAVLREVREETGLTDLTITQYPGSASENPPAGQALTVMPTTVYARPDVISFDWARLPRSVQVEIVRQSAGFTQIRFEELNRSPNPEYISMLIMGWVPDHTLTFTRRRHFFLLEFHGNSPDHWMISADNHRFTLFWAPLSALPPIIQAEWLVHLPVKYRLAD